MDFKSSSLSKCLGLTLWIASGSAYGGPCKDFSKDPTNSAESRLGTPLRMDVPSLIPARKSERSLHPKASEFVSEIAKVVQNPKSEFDWFAFLEASNNGWEKFSQRFSVDNQGEIPLLQDFFKVSESNTDFSGNDALINLGTSLGALSGQSILSRGHSILKPVSVNTLAVLHRFESIPVVGHWANRKVVARRISARKMVNDAIELIVGEERKLKETYAILQKFQDDIIAALPELSEEITIYEDTLLGLKEVSDFYGQGTNGNSPSAMAKKKVDQVMFAVEQKLKGLRNVQIALITGLDELEAQSRQVLATAAIHNDARIAVAPIMSIRIVSDLASSQHQRTMAVNRIFRSYAREAMKAAANRAEQATQDIISLAQEETFPEELVVEVMQKLRTSTQDLENFMSQQAQSLSERRAKRARVSELLKMALENRTSRLMNSSPKQLEALQLSIQELENQLKD
ncbi:MAG: hypothetical protein WCH11_04050 [Bdellovibrio sp.]